MQHQLWPGVIQLSLQLVYFQITARLQSLYKCLQEDLGEANKGSPDKQENNHKSCNNMSPLDFSFDVGCRLVTPLLRDD